MKTRNTVEPETQSQYENDAERCGVKKYIDLQRDYAFKYAFGREGNEDLLLLLLDSLMPEKHIRSVSIGPQEQIPDREDAKGGIYDINCQTDDDSYFNVEMQVCSQSDFNDRMVYYSSYSIRNYVGKGAQMEIDKELKEGLISKEEAEKKKLSQSFIRYKLPPIYIIGILNFELPGVEPSDSIIRSFSIREDANGTVQFTGSVHYITVELPKFGKSLSQLESRLDYMLYAIKKMGAMTGIPKKYNGKGFDKLFEVCTFASMPEDVQIQYVRQVMAEWDRQGQLATAIMEGEAKGRAEGRAEGEAKGRAETAKAMKLKGFTTQVIADITGLTPEQIAEL